MLWPRPLRPLSSQAPASAAPGPPRMPASLGFLPAPTFALFLRRLLALPTLLLHWSLPPALPYSVSLVPTAAHPLSGVTSLLCTSQHLPGAGCLRFRVIHLSPLPLLWASVSASLCVCSSHSHVGGNLGAARSRALRGGPEHLHLGWGSIPQQDSWDLLLGSGNLVGGDQGLLAHARTCMHSPCFQQACVAPAMPGRVQPPHSASPKEPSHSGWARAWGKGLWVVTLSPPLAQPQPPAQLP